MPYQLALRPIASRSFGNTAGVHSTEWIFAMTAALTRRATLNRRSSSQSGWKYLRWSQMALCSRTNRLCSIACPTHQLRLKPVSSTRCAFNGSLPSSCSFSRPPTWLRRRSCVAWSLP
jgi:hypothetical protein